MNSRRLQNTAEQCQNRLPTPPFLDFGQTARGRHGVQWRHEQPRSSTAIGPRLRLSVELPLAPTSDPGWLLGEEGFVLVREHEIESIFAVGNRYIGTRASLEEGSRASWPASFAAGVYVYGAASDLGPTLAVIPDWPHLEIAIENEALMVEIVPIAAGIGQAPPAEEIGAKAANLARVEMLVLPVPPAFVLPVQLGTEIIQGDLHGGGTQPARQDHPCGGRVPGLSYQTLVNAAKILGSIPAAMQLRYLQTLTEIGAEQNSTVVVPMPIDIIKPFLALLDKVGKAPGANGAGHIPLTKEVPLSA
jgi:hypothetical protein